MAYVPHILIAFGGALTEKTASDEIWECTLRAFPGSSGGPDSLVGASLDLQAWCNAMAGPLGTWFGSASQQNANNSNVSYVKANIIGTDGKYTSAATNVTDFTAVAGGSTQTIPSFCSVATSWGSNKARGPASHGRLYLPNYTFAVTGAEITGTAATAAMNSGKSLINLIRANTSGLSGGVMSPALVSSIGGAWAYINSVRVGNVVDTQRRRRNAVPETYVQTSV